VRAFWEPPRKLDEDVDAEGHAAWASSCRSRCSGVSATTRMARLRSRRSLAMVLAICGARTDRRAAPRREAQGVTGGGGPLASGQAAAREAALAPMVRGHSASGDAESGLQTRKVVPCSDGGGPPDGPLTVGHRYSPRPISPGVAQAQGMRPSGDQLEGPPHRARALVVESSVRPRRCLPCKAVVTRDPRRTRPEGTQTLASGGSHPGAVVLRPRRRGALRLSI
jgi:hypothetical protein